MAQNMDSEHKNNSDHVQTLRPGTELYNESAFSFHTVGQINSSCELERYGKS